MTSEPRPRPDSIVLALAIFAPALALRLVGIDFSGSTPWARPDEEIFVLRAMSMFPDGIDPGMSQSWPDLMFWIHHLIQRVVQAWLAWTQGSEPHLGCLFVLSPSSLILPVRVLCAVFGAATVVVLARAAAEAAPSSTTSVERRGIAIAASFFYGADVLAVRDSHYATSDTPMCFFLALLLLFAGRALRGAGLRHYAYAGLALGAAISTKWSALPFAFVPAAAVMLQLLRRGTRWLALRGTVLGLLGTVAAFVAGTPNFLFAPRAYLDGIASHAMRYDPNAARAFIYDASVEPSPGLVQHFFLSLPFGFGWPLLVLALVLVAVAIVRAWKLRAPALGVVALYAVIYYVVVLGRTSLNFVRYSLPVHPALALVAAALLPWLLHRIAPRAMRARPLATVTLTALSFSLSPIVRSIDVDRLLASPETRELAVRWLHEHVAEGELVATGVGYHGFYAVDAQLAARCAEELPDASTPWLPRRDGGGAGAVLVGMGTTRWNEVGEQAVQGQIFGRPSRLEQRWAVISQPFVPCERGVAPYFRSRHVPSCFHEVARFDQGDVDCETAYDVMDHYYIPLSLDPGALRPGPEVVVYENRCSRSSSRSP